MLKKIILAALLWPLLALAGTYPSPTFNNVTVQGTLTGFVGRLLNIQVFTSSGTYTPTSGTAKIIVEVQAPGGGSGGVASTSAGQSAVSVPGGGGSYAKALITSGFSGATVTIGAAGTAGAAGANSGGAGGVTSFGTFISCPGGSGGGGGSAVSAAANVGFAVASASPTLTGVALTITSIAGAPSAYSSVVVAAGTVATAASGGSSVLGNGGQGRGAQAVGSVGNGYGGGGGGSNNGASASAATGAAGAPAIIIVYEFSQ